MSSILLLAVDPGKTGALAFLDPATMGLVIHDMPLGKSSTGKDELDFLALAKLLRPEPGYSRHIAILERVSARPNDGAVQAFSFGQGYGALRMGIIGHGYEHHYVTPVSWKKHFRLSKDKGVSRSYAAARFPGYAEKFSRVKDDGRAEAALIALYGAETLALQPQSSAA